MGMLAQATATADYGPLPALFFYFFAAVIVGGALATALSRSIVRAAVGLLAALTGVSGMYLLLGAEFLAAAQLVVYVGGTLILMIFGIMLTSKAVGGGVTPRRREAVAAVAIAVLLAGVLGAVFSQVAWHGSSGGGVAEGASSQPSVQALGRALLSPAGYLAPFELLSFLLLAVMIGAAYLAKSRVVKTRGGAGGGAA